MKLTSFVILLILFGLVLGFPTVEAQTTTTEENGTTTDEKEPEKPPYQEELEKAFESGFLLGRGGSPILEDDFNSYNDGDLNSQGGWAGDVIFDIQGDIVLEGAKAVKITSGGGHIDVFKDGSSLTDGKQTIYFRKADMTSNRSIDMGLFNAGDEWATAIRFYGTRIDIFGDGDWKIIETGLSANTWYCAEIEWRSSPSYQVRGRVDGETWSDWYGCYKNGPYDRIGLHNGVMLGDGYFDYIAEFPFVMPTTTILIQNASTGAEFYLVKTISYGDFLVSFFLLILIIVLVIKLIFDNEIPKRINFKRQ